MVESDNAMNLSFKKAHELIKESEDIKIYTHIDCDGVTAGAVLSSMLDRLEKDHEIDFISLDKMEDLEAENELTIFSDLGSGQEMENFCPSKSKTLILDHHPPIRSLDNSFNGQLVELNPHFHNIDGSYEISGGGMAYLLARTFGFVDFKLDGSFKCCWRYAEQFFR